MTTACVPTIASARGPLTADRARRLAASVVLAVALVGAARFGGRMAGSHRAAPVAPGAAPSPVGAQGGPPSSVEVLGAMHGQPPSPANAAPAGT